jgi:hypothetical protein
MVFSATFKNISVVLVVETGGHGENHRPVATHWQTLSHNVIHLGLVEIRTHNISGDRHWLHKQLEIQLSCDHGDEEPSTCHCKMYFKYWCHIYKPIVSGWVDSSSFRINMCN